jgi:DNA polymerase III epsilon subunit-like protein
MSNPRGYNKYYLVCDTETSGLAYGQDDPSFDPATGHTYQAVSVGMIVVDSDTLTPIEKLYVEIKWDGVSEWSKSAEKIHGLSMLYLEDNGMDADEAVATILEMLIKYWGTDSPITMIGHNPASFDIWFLKRLVRSVGIELKFASKQIDTNSLGSIVLRTHNSDDLFQLVGCAERGEHNALTDAEQALQVCKTLRIMGDNCLA